MDDIKITVTEQLQQLQMLAHRAAFSGFGGAHSPHRGQGRVLAILRLKPEITQKELTYLLNMSKQAVAELTAKLEKSGYITREPSADDRRAVTIRLTEEGARAAEQTEDASPEATKFLDCLDGDELAAFSGYLERIIRQYEEQFPGEDFEQRRRMMEDFISHYGHGFGGHGHHHGHGFGGRGPGARGRGFPAGGPCANGQKRGPGGGRQAPKDGGARAAEDSHDNT